MDPSRDLKRKRRSSSDLSGIFTRSKTQIYIHPNRSGRARTDSSTKPVHKYYRLIQSCNENQIGEGILEVPMKDLRARRVFPSGPARGGSPNDEERIGGDGVGKGGENYNGLEEDVVIDGGSLCFFGVGNGDEKNGILEAEIDEGLVSDGKCLNDLGVGNEDEIVDMLEAQNCGDLVSDGKCLNDFGVENEVEKVEMAQNCGDLVSDGNSLNDFGVENEVEMLEARNDEDLAGQVVACDGGVEQLKKSDLRNRVVANLRPSKVFVAPGSFNYRRLLPFLEDIKLGQTATCKIGVVDGKSQSNLLPGNNESHDQKLSNTILNEQSVTENSSGGGHKCSSQNSNDEKNKDAESDKSGVLSITERNILGMVNNDADPVCGDSKLDNQHINVDVEQLKGSTSINRMVANMRSRMVFKPPGSFSYRRLLPFLEDTEKDQTASSKVERVNEKSPSNLKHWNLESRNQDDSIMAMNEQSVTGYCTGVPCKSPIESSHDERTGKAKSHKFVDQPVAEVDISGVVNNDIDSVCALMNNESLKNDLDDPTTVDDLMEEHLQSTPGQDTELLVNKHLYTASGDSILNNGDSKFYGVNHSDEESDQSISEQDIARVVKNIAETVLGESVLNGGMGNDWDGMTGVVDLQEVDVQMTPPDAVIFTTPEIGGCPQDIAGKGSATKSILPGHTSNSVKDRKGVCNINMSSVSSNQSNVTPSNMDKVLHPCSRKRVFKPLGSFSYRRLLPYLTSASGDQHPGFEKTFKEGSSTNHFKPESSPKMQEAGENKDNQTVVTATPNVSSLNSDCGSNSFDQMSSSVTSVSINDRLKVFDLPSEEPLQAVNAESYFLSKRNPELSIEKEVSLHTNISCSSFNQNTVLTDSKKEESQTELDGNGQEFMHVDNEPLGGTIATKDSPSKDLLLDPKSHLSGSPKGILKRNPRGCRGLCDCLHCASFRLRAERTFEFSRNQLQDAEEVAFDLVKELSSLRQLLESSTAEATDPTVIHLNQLQIKEACRKALEAEKLAKERLNEMNEDLSNHCRTKNLSRPRVTFLSVKPRIEPTS